MSHWGSINLIGWDANRGHRVAGVYKVCMQYCHWVDITVRTKYKIAQEFSWCIRSWITRFTSRVPSIEKSFWFVFSLFPTKIKSQSKKNPFPTNPKRLPAQEPLTVTAARPTILLLWGQRRGRSRVGGVGGSCVSASVQKETSWKLIPVTEEQVQALSL